MLSLAEFY